MSEGIPNIYKITYSNHLEFEGCLLAFRKKELFYISNIPKWIPFNYSANCWVIKRKQLTLQKAKELIKHEPKQIDVSNLQWYLQIELDECFNLEKHD